MKGHKKPPINNNKTMRPVDVSNLQKAASETAEQAKSIVYEALRQEFGFGPARIAKLQSVVAEIERHKSFDAWVDYTIKQKI
ncbi:hypothetical protein HP567_012895 [Brevibacillus sp. M2.1A]|uniref:hypothetical protein n=1 Tax=Brevibacillus sp. M2.1A TaxID=2738980 RepID=UPI00156AAEA6|nr:hypothetical protein [Brevibacillus sp. M2.1A]MCC8435443.1 hypothetical protein [Brevibacillus sp. M2.1A]